MLWLLCLAPGIGAAEVRVFAAASLKTALDDVIEAYEDGTTQRVIVSYAGTSALARQIQHGAPADLFLSANTAWMDALQAQGLVEQSVVLASNRLVLIGPPDTPGLTLASDLDLVGMLDGGRLAMALVHAVPAGIYGRQALEQIGLWDGLAPHVAQFPNVRAAMVAVASRAAPLGVVYATDARADRRVRVLAAFPSDSHDPIQYAAGVLKPANPEAAAFWAYLTEQAKPVFRANGFLPPQGRP